MFHRCVASQMQWMLVGLRLSSSVPPVSSAWQRFKGGPSLLTGVFANSQALSTFHYDSPMAIDILNSDLTRTDAATRDRHVRQRVSLVVPSRGIRINTSSRLNEVYKENRKGRLYHHDTDQSNMDVSVPNNCKRHLQQKTRQNFLEPKDYVRMPECPERNQTRTTIRVKLQRKTPPKAKRKQAPKDVPSTSDSEKDSLNRQKSKNPINHWFTIFCEKSKRVREELEVGRIADLKVHSAVDEAKIVHYKNRYVTQIQNKTSGLRSKSVKDKQGQHASIATLSHNNCPKNSKNIKEEVMDIKSKSKESTENLENIAPTISLAPSPPPKAPLKNNQYLEDLTPVTESKDATFKEAERESPGPRASFDNIRAREESLLSCIRRETIDRWRAHRLVRPNEPMPYHFPKPMKMDRKEKGPPEVLSLDGDDHHNSKVILTEVKSILVPTRNSSNCKSDMRIISPKATLQENKYYGYAEVFNQLKNDIHRRLWKLSDDGSLKEDGFKNSKDKAEWKFRVAEMISKCLFAVQNKMMNESREGIDYQEPDKNVGEIAEEFFSKFKEDLQNLANEKLQDSRESSSKNESGGKFKGTWSTDKSKCPEKPKKCEESRGQRNCGMLYGGISYLSNHELCLIVQQIDDIVHQCQRIKYEINKKAASDNLKKERAGNDNTTKVEERSGPIAETDVKEIVNRKLRFKIVNKIKDPAEEHAEEQLENNSELKNKCVIQEITELIRQTKCSEMRLRKKLEELTQMNELPDNKKREEMEQRDKYKEIKRKEKCREVKLCEECEEKWEEQRDKCEVMEQKAQCKEMEQTEKCKEIEQKEKCEEDEENKKRENAQLNLGEKCEQRDIGKMMEEIDEIFKEIEIRMKRAENDENEKKELKEKSEEMELREKYVKQKCEDEEMQQRKKCEKMELKEKCEKMELKEKCEEMELKERCEAMAQRVKCAENDKKTNKKCEEDDEKGPTKAEYQDLRKKLLQLLKEICEEDDVNATFVDKTKENEESKEVGSDKYVAVDLLKKFKFPYLKHLCGTFDRQKRCAEEHIERLRRILGLGLYEEDELCKSPETEKLCEISKPQNEGTATTIEEERPFPSFQGIFRPPALSNECSQDTLCGPVHSVSQKLNGLYHREVSLDHLQSLVYNSNPQRFQQSNFFRDIRFPNLIPLTINDYLRFYWLRQRLPANQAFYRRNHNEYCVLFSNS